MSKQLVIYLFFFLFPFSCFSNNLQVGSVTVSTTGNSQYLNFSISWENSWRINSSPFNWDAVWIFVKRRDCAGMQWHHANLSTSDNDHSASSPLFVDAYSDKKGVMIYRSAVGSGNINNATVQLKLDSVPVGSFEYKVFGIEMVYVPQGSFYVGDGVSYATFQKGNSPTHEPFKITSEAALLVSGDTCNCLGYNSAFGITPYTLPAEYPKGYKAFYAMKYEISQGQYADFLNTLNQDASQKHYASTYPNPIRLTIHGNWPLILADVPDRACNYLSFTDLAAYLDWSALSPMTELEFEKLCRGDTSNSPVSGEFAWGGNMVTSTDSITSGTLDLPNESVGTPIAIGTGPANYQPNAIQGPLRCGYAAKSGTSKAEAGASIYGAMELSGNVYERCYNIAYGTLYTTGWQFTGSHGDGELSITPSPGFANQGWPAEAEDLNILNEDKYSVAARGGGWSSTYADLLRVSDRAITSITSTIIVPPDQYGRQNAFGGRGVSRRQ